jgi:serine O-acetyltransferase
MLTIKNSSRRALILYLERQLDNLFPDGQEGIHIFLDRHIDEALSRLQHCINAVKMWAVDEFDYLHSSQYATFLYYLSNTIWQREKHHQLCAKLFYLNKSLNGIDLFYEIDMPEIFFIGHSVGIVLAKAHYSNYLVLYQNSTVGKNHGIAPRLEEGVILYPNTAIIGGCNIACGSVISQGVSVINRDTQAGSLCFQGADGGLVFKKSEKNILAYFFRI